MLKWKQNEDILYAFGRSISVKCDVRNEINRRRLASQIVYSIPDKKPYQPRIFPKGIWSVGKPIPKQDQYMAPFFIPTDAYQKLPVWTVKDGKYVRQTEDLIIDRGYGLHFSTSETTLGCIKVIKKEDLLWLVETINNAINNGEKIMLEVS